MYTNSFGRTSTFVELKPAYSLDIVSIESTTLLLCILKLKPLLQFSVFSDGGGGGLGLTIQNPPQINVY